MSNPIYILQLSDWHLKNGKEKSLNEFIDTLSNKLNKFLSDRNRKVFNIIAITGDMMHINGNKSKKEDKLDENHQLVIDSINKLKCEISNDDTQIYVTPGNHDTDLTNTSNIILKEKNKKILETPWLPNYLIIDKEKENLIESFTKFQDFAKKINATNAKNPFNHHGVYNQNSAEIFVSWFNSSWLSNSNWRNLEIKYKHDEQNLSVGNSINDKTVKAFNEFKKNCTNKNSFTMSLFHHYPRLLSWHDQNSVTKEVKMDDYITPLNESIYSHFNQYDLVLNGHTHGKLCDPPYHTCHGLFTPESDVSDNYISIIEVDLNRSFYVIHDIDIPLKKEKEKENNRRAVIYNHSYFERKIKSNYNLSDLYDDLYSNDLLPKDFLLDTKDLKFKSENKNICLKFTRESDNGLILATCNSEQRKNPFVIENIDNERKAINAKLNLTNK